jgi:deoxyribose-phosphate aldolase
VKYISKAFKMSFHKYIDRFFEEVDERKLASVIDYTLLKVDADNGVLMSYVEDVRRYGFRCLVLSPYQAMMLLNSGVRDICIASVVGFPSGYIAKDVKVFEAEKLFRSGVNEVDMVINIQAFKSRNYGYVYEEIRSVVDIAKKYNGFVKVIIEAPLLSDEEKIKAVDIVVEADADYVKTSTGFLSNTTLHDVYILWRAANGRIKIKAAGGIRNALDAISMLLIGADIIGTSSAIKIVDEYKKIRGR